MSSDEQSPMPGSAVGSDITGRQARQRRELLGDLGAKIPHVLLADAPHARSALMAAQLLLAPGGAFFGTGGVDDDDWVTLLDDPEPETWCKTVVVTNYSDWPMDVRVRWDGTGDPETRTYPIRPHSSIVLACTIELVEVRGPQGASGSWYEPDTDDEVRIFFCGAGVAFEVGPGKAPNCRVFRVTNLGKKRARVTVTRAAGGSHETTHNLAPGNSIKLRCTISRLRIDGADDGLVEVREILDF